MSSLDSIERLLVCVGWAAWYLLGGFARPASDTPRFCSILWALAGGLAVMLALLAGSFVKPLPGAWAVLIISAVASFTLVPPLILLCLASNHTPKHRAVIAWHTFCCLFILGATPWILSLATGDRAAAWFGLAAGFALIILGRGYGLAEKSKGVTIAASGILAWSIVCLLLGPTSSVRFLVLTGVPAWILMGSEERRQRGGNAP